MPHPPPLVDHLVLFTPCNPHTRTPLVPPALAAAFTITPGGTHADGLTANALVLFADGSYLELICFVHDAAPEDVQAHWWGPDARRVGWADWCLTSAGPGTAGENLARLNDGVASAGCGGGTGGGDGVGDAIAARAYEQPVQGGRKRPDGQMVQWSVTFPAGGAGVRGKVPFFCHDETARELRVPTDADKRRHACGARGVLGLSVVVAERAEFERLCVLYEAVLGVEGVRTGPDTVEFEIGRVEEVRELGARKPRVVLRMAGMIRTESGEVLDERTELCGERGFYFGGVQVGAVKEGGGENKGSGPEWVGEGDGKGKEDIGVYIVNLSDEE